MNFELLKEAKENYRVVTDVFGVLQENGWISLRDGLDIQEVFEYEICKYIMFLIKSDGRIDVSEVQVFRFITEYGDDLSSLKETIESDEDLYNDFQAKVPLCFILLIDGFNTFLMENPEKEDMLAETICHYILVYTTIGKVLIEADNSVSYAEKKDLHACIKTLFDYLYDKSYLNRHERISGLAEILDEYV